MSVLQRIKDLASLRGISLAELERQTQLSSGSITKWDKSSPSADKLNKIADFFGVSVDYLLGRTDNQTNTDNIQVDKRAAQIGGLFRSVADAENLDSKQEEELKEDLDWYLRERARRIKERNSKGK